MKVYVILDHYRDELRGLTVYTEQSAALANAEMIARENGAQRVLMGGRTVNAFVAAWETDDGMVIEMYEKDVIEEPARVAQCGRHKDHAAHTFITNSRQGVVERACTGVPQ